MIFENTVPQKKWAPSEEGAHANHPNGIFLLLLRNLGRGEPTANVRIEILTL